MLSFLLAKMLTSNLLIVQDALEVDAFSRSEEAQAAEDLFDAYRAGSNEDVKQCVSKRSVFLDLDNQVKLCPNLAWPEYPEALQLSKAEARTRGLLFDGARLEGIWYFYYITTCNGHLRKVLAPDLQKTQFTLNLSLL